jgi:hypothetical protein
MTLDEALEVVKDTSKNNSGIITQDFFEYLYHTLPISDRSVFIITLANMGINTRTGCDKKTAEMIRKDLDICKVSEVTWEEFDGSKDRILRQLSSMGKK